MKPLKTVGLLALVVAVYISLNLVFPQLTNWFATTYIVKPLLWSFVAVVALILARYWSGPKHIFDSSVVKLALAIGLVQVLVFIAAGFFFGFGRSPYLFTPRALVMNFVMVSTTLVGMEFSRAYLVNVISRRYFASGLVFTALLYAFISLPLANLIAPREPQQMIIFLASKPLPFLAESLLTSLLAFLGGPFAAIAYRGVLQGFEWFSPILPDLPWMATAFLGVVIPVISILIVGRLNQEKLPEAQSQSLHSEEKSQGFSVFGWIAVGIVGVLIVWFFSGLFGYQPILIAGRSMSPAIELGDIAITTKVDANSIKVGDVICYKTERNKVIHRVIKVRNQGNSRLFVTKGDANDSPDTNPVHPDQIIGKVTFVMPKLGWVSIGIKNLIGKLVG